MSRINDGFFWTYLRVLRFSVTDFDTLAYSSVFYGDPKFSWSTSSIYSLSLDDYRHFGIDLRINSWLLLTPSRYPPLRNFSPFLHFLKNQKIKMRGKIISGNMNKKYPKSRIAHLGAIAPCASLAVGVI